MIRPVAQTAIAVKLKQLVELYAQRDVLRIEQDTLISDAIPDWLQIVLAEIDLEFKQKREAVQEKIAALEKAVGQPETGAIGW